MKFNLLNYLAVFTILLSGCYPGGAEYVDELDTSIGLYDTEFDFTASASNEISYYLNPKVVHIKDGDSIKSPNPGNDQKLINSINTHLSGLDYTAITPPTEGPFDHTIDVLVTVLESNYSGYYWYYDWYNWWGWYYPGWGYPGGGYPVYYNYKIGTVVINFVDPNFDASKNKKAAYYMGGLNGLLKGSDRYIQTRVDSGLNDLFNQAPFNK